MPKGIYERDGTELRDLRKPRCRLKDIMGSTGGELNEYNGKAAKKRKYPNRLTEKMRVFLTAYLISNNKSKSMEFAGYDYRDDKKMLYKADEILAKGDVKEYLAKRKRALANTDIVDVEWIVREILSNIELARDQKKTGDVNKGLELLARYKLAEVPMAGEEIASAMGSIEYEKWLRSELALIESQRQAGTALAV